MSGALETQRSAIEELFGKNRAYPLVEPVKRQQMRKLRWRVWHRATAVWATLPLWGTAALVPITVLSGHYNYWFCEFGVGGWAFLTAMITDVCELRTAAHDKPYLPPFWRRYHGISSEPYSADELRVLEVVWRLEESIRTLRHAHQQLEAQISGTDLKRHQGFEDEARQALARGERALAQSLLEAKAEAESHVAAVQEQLTRLGERLRLLEAKQYHLKSRLATRHLQRQAIAAQTEALRADAAAVEAVGAEPLEPITVAIPGDGLARLRDDALDAEAHVRALLELEQPLELPMESLSGEALEQALSMLKLEVETRRAITAS